MEVEDIRAFGLAQPVCVAPNGIAVAPQDPEAVRHYYWSLAPALKGQRILLFYSRFHSKKRIRELLRDFADLAPRHPGWHLLAVGIPEEYSVDALRAEARHLKVEERATILDGSGAPAPYALADLFVLPTHSENFGQVVVEALAEGVPVLTTTGTPWVRLDDVGAGRCIALQDLPRTLRELMALGGDRLCEMGARGRAWALKEFDWGTTARRLLDFYERLRSPGGRA
jgi:glycosyltransferase involved in cell wall biosynthesis